MYTLPQQKSVAQKPSSDERTAVKMRKQPRKRTTAQPPSDAEGSREDGGITMKDFRDEMAWNQWVAKAWYRLGQVVAGTPVIPLDTIANRVAELKRELDVFELDVAGE
jgi:hypothetical protein